MLYLKQGLTWLLEPKILEWGTYSSSFGSSVQVQSVIP